MALSGKDGAWLNGDWCLRLPAEAWVVWLVDGSTRNSKSTAWKDVPNRICGVCVFHPMNKKTWMYGVDGYPDPTGGTEIKLGEQIGELDCQEWIDFRTKMKREANEWQQYII